MVTQFSEAKSVDPDPPLWPSETSLGHTHLPFATHTVPSCLTPHLFTICFRVWILPSDPALCRTQTKPLLDFFCVSPYFLPKEAGLRTAQHLQRKKQSADPQSPPPWWVCRTIYLCNFSTQKAMAGDPQQMRVNSGFEWETLYHGIRWRRRQGRYSGSASELHTQNYLVPTWKHMSTRMRGHTERHTDTHTAYTYMWVE